MSIPLLFAVDSNISGNIIGSFIAVAGAICLLFLSEWWRSRKEKNKTKSNFLREILYNKEMLKECKKSLTQVIERLSVGAEDLYFNYNSSNILNVSIGKAYQEGLLYDRLRPEQIARLNTDVLTFFGSNNYPIENFVRDAIDKWKKKEISTQDLYSTLDWVKGKADEAIKFLSKIETDFKKQK